MKVNWEKAGALEQQFWVHIFEQMDYGFLVDKELIEKHIATLEKSMDDIYGKVYPLLPLRCVAKVKAKKGIFPCVEKPFKKNKDYSQAAIDWYEDDVEQVGGKFSRIIWEKVDINSNKQLKEYLLDEGWIPDKWNFNKETGKRTSPKLSHEDEFRGIKGEVGKDVAHRLICRHRKSQLEGWHKRIRPDGRLTAGASGLTITGRLKHTNVVNIPGGEWGDDGEWKGAFFGHEMRSVFIAKKGYKIVGCDADQFQLRLLCHFMGDDDYTKAVTEGSKDDGTDIHSVNQKKAGLSTRAQGKQFIYAFLFGAGDAKLALQLGISLKEVKKVRAKFLKELPKLSALIDSLKRVWKSKGYLVGVDGRKILIDKEHTLLVFLMQATEAILMKVATCYACKWIEARGLDAHLCAHMHDEYCFECVDEDCQEVGELLSRAIVKSYEYFDIKVQGAAEWAVGDCWGDVH